MKLFLTELLCSSSLAAINSWSGILFISQNRHGEPVSHQSLYYSCTCLWMVMGSCKRETKKQQKMNQLNKFCRSCPGKAMGRYMIPNDYKISQI